MAVSRWTGEQLGCSTRKFLRTARCCSTSGIQAGARISTGLRGSAGGAELDGLGDLPELIVREMVPLIT